MLKPEMFRRNFTIFREIFGPCSAAQRCARSERTEGSYFGAGHPVARPVSEFMYTFSAHANERWSIWEYPNPGAFSGQCVPGQATDVPACNRKKEKELFAFESTEDEQVPLSNVPFIVR